MSVGSVLLDILFPPKCVYCRSFVKTGKDLTCPKCRTGLPYTEKGSHKEGEGFEGCYAPLYYEGNVRESLLRFKFKGCTGYASEYGKLLAGCIRDNIDKYDIITWVPLSKNRYKSRGYDQSMLLAMAAALELGDVAVQTLEKHLEAEKQSLQKSPEDRRRNIKGAYRVTEPELVEGKRILLIDDIVTTGSTLAECSKMLMDAGAESIVCAAVARGRE